MQLDAKEGKMTSSLAEAPLALIISLLLRLV